MHLSRPARIALRLLAWSGLGFLYLPLVVVAALSLNRSKNFVWPPSGYTLHWWSQALHNDGARSALWVSVRLALCAAIIALVLGTLLAFALQRFTFFGRTVLSFVVVLPIALPGIVTGIAMNAGFHQLGLDLGFVTLVIAHATFCVVLVYNNVVARLRRMSPSLEEASADLGADSLQTFVHVTFPLVRSALLAGGLLAVALSFDEIVVTTFTSGVTGKTLPQWIFDNLARPNQLPIVNVVATAVVLGSIVPVWLAQRLAGGEGAAAGRVQR
jgi:putative spermidine/putrescine transport system permease protein